MPARAGRNAGGSLGCTGSAFHAPRTRVRSEMRPEAARAGRWHRDCVDHGCTCGRARGKADGGSHNGMLCSLSSSCLAVCGLIPLSRAKESYGHAHGWYGERFVGPWNLRRHSHRARLARPHSGAHEVPYESWLQTPRPRAPRRGGGGVFGDFHSSETWSRAACRPWTSAGSRWREPRAGTAGGETGTMPRGDFGSTDGTTGSGTSCSVRAGESDSSDETTGRSARVALAAGAAIARTSVGSGVAFQREAGGKAGQQTVVGEM
jgi:hypothetical protein